MEDVQKLEGIAKENINLARHEKELAKTSLESSKLEIKRAKARELLAKNELILAETRKDLANKRKMLLEKKRMIKKERIIDFSEDELKKESDYVLYFEKIAKAQIDIAEISKKIVEMERKIANQRKVIANLRLNSANTRDKLVKKLESYVRIIKLKLPEEKISKSKDEYLRVQRDVETIKKDFLELETLIKKNENKLANLNNELSLKLSEREKIRHQNIEIE